MNGDGDGDAGIWATWQESPPAAKALLVGIFVNRLGAFLQVFLVLFLTTRGFTPVQAGVALAVFTVGAVLGGIVGGTLTDRIGPRLTILISMLGGAALVLSILYLTHYPALVLVVGLAGAVGGAYRPAAGTLLSELTPRHRQVMIFAMYRLFYNLGNTAAPLIGAALVAASYDLLFWGEAIASLGYGLIAAVALPRRRAAAKEPSRRRPARRAGRGAGGAAVRLPGRARPTGGTCCSCSRWSSTPRCTCSTSARCRSPCGRRAWPPAGSARWSRSTGSS